MEVTNTPGCCGCNRCRKERDTFPGEALSPKWNVVSDPTNTTVAGGKLVLSSTGIIEVVRERDLLAEGERGAKVVVESRLTEFDGTGSARAVRMAWEADDAFLELWVVTVPTTGDIRASLRKWVAGTPTTLVQLDDFPPDDQEGNWRLEVCLFEEAPGEEGSPWIFAAKLRELAGGPAVELITRLEEYEPTTLRTSLAASGGVSSLAYEYDNWELHKIDDGCSCDGKVPCLVGHIGFEGADSTDLSAEWEELDGDWQRVSEELDPPATGTIRLKTVTPSPSLTGYKWQANFTFGGATGIARWRVNWAEGGEAFYAELECTGSSAATIKLFSTVDGSLADAVSVPAFDWDDWHNVAVCLRESSLVATVNNEDATVFAEVEPLEGLNVGLETESVGTAARFDDAELSRLGDDCEGCVEPAPCCACNNLVTRKFLRARIAGTTLFGGLTVTCASGDSHTIAGDYAASEFNKLWILPLVECVCSPTNTTLIDCVPPLDPGDANNPITPKYLKYEKLFLLPEPPDPEDVVNEFTVTVEIFQKEDATWWIQGTIFVNDEIVIDGPNFTASTFARWGPEPWSGEGNCLNWDDVELANTRAQCHLPSALTNYNFGTSSLTVGVA